MKKLKWLTLFLAAISLSVGIAACKKDGEDESPSNTNPGGSYSSMATTENLNINVTRLELGVGDTYKILATDKDGGTITFTSSNTDVITVGEDGTVTAVGEGTAFVTVKAGEAEKVCRVTVSSEAYTLSLNFTDVNVVLGSQKEITATVKLNGEAVNADVAWSYEAADGVASWTENGNSTLITTLTTGTVKVTAKLNAISASCTIRIMETQAEVLGTPELTLTGCDTLSWTAVDGAAAYGVQVNGGLWQETTSLGYDLTAVADTMEAYTVRVRALADKASSGYYDGDSVTLEVDHAWSEQTVEGTATCVQAGKVKFECNNCDRGYEEESYYAPHAYADGACAVCGDYQTPELIYEFDTNTNSYLVAGIQNTFSGGPIYVASLYNDGTSGSYPVTGVKAYAFSRVKNITKAVLPESVTTIGNDAFYYCSSLETVVMTGVTGLGENAFLACMNLKAIVVDKDFALNGQVFSCNVGGYTPILNVFVDGIENDSNIQLKGNNNMFTGYKYYAPRGLNASCGEWEFDENGDVTYSVHNYVSDRCENCDAQDPKGISYEYNAASDSYTVLGLLDTFEGNVLNIPATYADGVNGERPVTKIGTQAFYLNNTIERAILAESVTALGMDAFFRATALQFISMVGVTDLSGGNAFTNCPALETVIVNPNLNAYAQNFNVSASSFPDYVAKVNVYVNGTETGEDFYMQNRYEIDANSTIIWKNNMFTGNIYFYDAWLTSCGTWAWVDDVENGEVKKREAHVYGSDGTCTNVDQFNEVCGRMDGKGVDYAYDVTTDSYIVKDATKATGAVEILSQFNDGENGLKDVTAIAANAFYLGNNTYNTKLTSIEIPNTVTSIGGQAFGYCSGLTEIVLPESVTMLGSQAFWRCINLKTVTMTGVTTFTEKTEENVFLSCNSLKAVIVGSSFVVDIQVASTNNVSQVGQCTVYVSATQDDASVSIIHNETVGTNDVKGSPNNALFAEEVLYLTASNMEWYLDQDGNVAQRNVE